MILGCHLALDEAIRAHRQDELDRADAALVRAAWDSKLAWAFQQADPECKPGVLERAVLVPWYIEDFVGFRDRPDARPTLADPYLPQVDMPLLRRVITERKAVMLSVSEARRAMLAEDAEAVERPFQGGLPDLATTVAWPGGGARRVFHATTAEFGDFKPVSHFGSAVAVSRHVDKGWRYGRDGEDVRIVGAALKIDNPLRVEDDGQMSSCWLVVAAHRAGALDRRDVAAIFGVGPGDLEEGGAPRTGSVRAEFSEIEGRLADRLLDAGHDGLVYRNRIEGGGDSWVVLTPDQVVADREWRYRPTEDGTAYVLLDPAEPSRPLRP
jgi:hypothetical protein